ncbi:MAG: MBL fold metallo-hydrolase [Chitinophagales bacterium]|nr:MBL fold metallo-hydrolase [Chitinophagales bacterium]
MTRIFSGIALLIAFLSIHSCTDYGLNVKKIDNHLYAVLGEGGNSGVFFCDTAVVVIDTKMKQGAERLQRWVNDKAKGKKIYIINTHVHKDHTSGNHLYSNPTIIAGDYGVQFWDAISSKEDLPNRWLADTLLLPMGDDTLLIENVGQVHTYADVIVYFKNRKVLFAGDIILNKYHPYLDEHAGSNVENYINTLSGFIKEFTIKKVVPGHGEIGGSELVNNFRQYMIDMEDVAAYPDNEIKMREKYSKYLSLPLNRAGFDQTISFINKSGTLRE